MKACMFAVMGSPCTGVDDFTMKAVCNMSNGLICSEFERLMFILDEELKQLELVEQEEKTLCTGVCTSAPNTSTIK